MSKVSRKGKNSKSKIQVQVQKINGGQTFFTNRMDSCELKFIGLAFTEKLIGCSDAFSLIKKLVNFLEICYSDFIAEILYNALECIGSPLLVQLAQEPELQKTYFSELKNFQQHYLFTDFSKHQIMTFVTFGENANGIWQSYDINVRSFTQRFRNF